MSPESHITDKLAHLRVLIVDDSPLARRVGMIALKSAGYHSVQQASSAREALDAIGSPVPTVDVILCDLMMPEMDGVQFLRYAADLPQKPALVFVSGGDAALLQGAQDTARARDFRVLGVIQKPVTAESIGITLARYHEVEPIRQQAASLDVAAELPQAIAEQQFVLHFQPKVSVGGRELVGVEALVRWQHPQHGLVGPGAFIPSAEESGQIGELTELILDLALEQSAEWSRRGFVPKLSVNLSPHMLGDVQLPDRLERKVSALEVNPQLLVLEVTESGVFQDLANTLEILTRLRMKGFSLSIDDFGTGYSSMDQLRKVPFSELKIDRAFVNGAAENDKARAILEGSVRLGHALKMTTVAEGVETLEDWSVLADAGVDLVQGFFIAKPMPTREFDLWATSHAR